MLPHAACSLTGLCPSTVWWQQDQFNEPQGFYMAIYAGLGVSQAIGLFLMGAAAAFFGYNASKSLHFGAARRVLLAPMSYFDTTPLGRIVSRFAKDVDTIDNTLNDSFRMALSTFGQVLGAVVIVAIVNQWFLIPLAVIAVFYARALKYYRSGARQVKQLDNLLRSALYAHFSESLSGITTIRACGSHLLLSSRCSSVLIGQYRRWRGQALLEEQ